MFLFFMDYVGRKYAAGNLEWPRMTHHLFPEGYGKNNVLTRMPTMTTQHPCKHQYINVDFHHKQGTRTCHAQQWPTPPSGEVQVWVLSGRRGQRFGLYSIAHMTH